MKFCIPVNSRKMLQAFCLKSALPCLFTISFACATRTALITQFSADYFVHISGDSARCKLHRLIVLQRKTFNRDQSGAQCFATL